MKPRQPGAVHGKDAIHNTKGANSGRRVLEDESKFGASACLGGR